MRRRVYQTRQDARDPHDLHGGPTKWHWHEPTGYVFFERWAKVGQLNLRGEEYRLLCALVASCDWSNECHATLAHLGRLVGLARSRVSRAMERLVSKRLVVREQHPTVPGYRLVLSPELCWKGRPWHLARAREQFAAQWRLRHGTPHGAWAGPGAQRDGSSPPGMGPSAAGEDPYIVQQALDIISSV